MKVLHIIPSMEIGGAQKLLSDLLPLQMKQADVTLLVFKSVNNALVDKLVGAGVKVISQEVKNVYNPLIIFKLKKYIKGYDVVHVHLFPALYWVAFASGSVEGKLIFTEHSTSNSRRGKRWLLPLERLVYGKYSEVVSISPQTRTALNLWLGRECSREVILNGICVEAFAGAASGVQSSDSIVMVSRFAPSKDQETVIRAMRYIDADVRLKFVGDGPLMAKNIELAESLGLAHRIDFIGAADDVARYIVEAKVGVQSSHWEGFGLTAVEIMACGRPVVASDVPGLKQIVQDAGLLFKAGDPEELARTVNSLIEDEQLYLQTARSCAERAAEYDIKKTAEGYWRVYNG